MKNGPAVVAWRVRGQGGNGQPVAGKFSIQPHAAQADPDQRIGPVQHLQKARQPAHKDVVALQMGQFVKEDVP